ncbi:MULTISPECIES: ISL3 family transposase [Aphanothece]|uniref:ISL3 family transposase n=2 Tax=Aphanothece TaxID=1121 RepID=UPI0039855F08
MDLSTFCRKALGIESPWRIGSVTVDDTTMSVTVHVERTKSSKGTCPECGATCSIHDRRDRRWRDLQWSKYRMFIEASVPRVRCPEHGVLNETPPWCVPNSRFTIGFEEYAVSLMLVASISAVSKLLDVDWKTLDAIMQRAVDRGLDRRRAHPVPVLCVDETSFQKRHEYVTIVSDGTTGAVLYVGDDRTEASLMAFYEALTPEQRASVGSVNMDMWVPYIEATSMGLEEGDRTICFDRFHVAQMLNKAVNDVRKQEHRAELREHGESALTGKRMSVLRNYADLTKSQQRDLQEVFAVAENTAMAWSIKEQAKLLWKYVSFHWAERAWNVWLEAAEQTALTPIIKVAQTVKNHLWGILNAVVFGVSNAMAESINSRIKMIKSRARGFRSRERFRRAILFYCGNLDMSF